MHLWGVRRRACRLVGCRWLDGEWMVGMVLSWHAGMRCGSRGEPLCDGVFLGGGQTEWFVGARVVRMIWPPLVGVLFVCSTYVMVNRCHVDLVVLE